jgi:acetoin utilization deacetylase AcuC-like enzyme
MLCVLEGGYNVNELAEAVVGVMKGLVGEEELPEPVPKVTYENMDILCHL